MAGAAFSSRARRWTRPALHAAFAVCVAGPTNAWADDIAARWPAYGSDEGGTRYSTAADITPSNVDGLRRQWSYHTGDATRRTPALLKRSKTETTPILVARPARAVHAVQRGDRARPRRWARTVAPRPANRARPAPGESLQLPRRRAVARPGKRASGPLRHTHPERHQRCAADRARRGRRQALPRLRRTGRGARRRHPAAALAG